MVWVLGVISRLEKALTRCFPTMFTTEDFQPLSWSGRIPRKQTKGNIKGVELVYLPVFKFVFWAWIPCAISFLKMFESYNNSWHVHSAYYMPDCSSSQSNYTNHNILCTGLPSVYPSPTRDSEGHKAQQCTSLFSRTNGLEINIDTEVTIIQ